MKIYKFVFLFLVCISTTYRGFSQPKDYDDFYKNISFLTDEKIYSKLQYFQKLDPHFANIYAQLGAVAYRLMLKSDPLKDFNQTIKVADDGMLYLSLFTHYMDEKESRANKTYYGNLPIQKTEDRFSNSDLKSFSAHLNQQLKDYSDSLKLVYGSLQNSKEYYGKSIEIYTSLNKRFFNLNEVLLQSDSLLIEEIKRLKESSDSTIFYFNTYSNLIKNFPLKDYHQKYQFKPIKTFRLDGLSNSNFLVDEFEIWDFGSWVNEFQTVCDTEIVPLRNEITKINNWFTQNEALLAQKKLNPQNLTKLIFDEKFIFILGKFDNNSLVRELFLYRKQKLEFLKLYADTLNTDNDTTIDLLSRKARFYNDLKTNKQNADSLLLIFEHAITPERINRFSMFFNKAFNGREGLVEFCDNQKKELNNLLNVSYANLGSYLKFIDGLDTKSNYAKYKNDSIPLYLVPTEYPEKYMTNSIYRMPENSTIISGFEISKNNAIPFISYIDNQNKVKWVKQIDKPAAVGNIDLDMLNSKLYAYKGACIGLFNKLSPEPINVFIKLDTLGKQLSQSTIAIDAMPVFLSFDDINQKAIIACKGKNKLPADLSEAATICLTDSVGNIIWKTTFEVAGNIADIIKSENQYQVFINYKSYNINGNIGISANNGSEWGLLVVNMDELGNIIKVIPIKHAYSMHVKNIIKLSGQSICLIGYKSPPGETSGEIYFGIINSSGKIIYSN